ncbi:MAG: hypothetical protein J6S50_10870 [Oscillospiraceae bacterium]|nr:hypothetical protein [Oscillospiraceae bacterium]
MDIWDIKREALIPVWQERIRECRSSGLTVRAWCAMNNISRQTYYNWEKMCLSRVEQNPKRSEETRGQDNALIKFNPELLPSSTEPISSISISSAELVIRCGCVSMDISPQMPVSRIAELVSALNSHV